MAFSQAGRHRAAGSTNALAAIGNLDSVVKSSAVLAVSGGLVAAFSLPQTGGLAAAKTTVEQAKSTTSVAARPAFTAPKASASGKSTAARVGGESVVAVAKGPSQAQLRAAETARLAAEANAASSNAAASRNTAGASRSAERTTLNFPDAPATTGGVIGVARQYTGLPYLYGGSSPSTGFDCSGFTSYVFRQVGISLPRTAEQQRQAVTPVSNPQPGDLVFFGAPAYHVGIYVGNGQMIDSPRTGSSIGIRSIWNRGNATFGRAG